MKYIFIIIGLILMTDSNEIHQDRILKIDKSGNIIGLPKNYGPAKFNEEEGYLRIKNKEIIFPYCIKRYFDIHEKSKVNLSASWYHSKDILPYYLNFKISQVNKNYTYNILINLETLELIEVEISIYEEDSYIFHKIKLDDDCTAEYVKRIKSLD